MTCTYVIEEVAVRHAQHRIHSAEPEGSAKHYLYDKNSLGFRRIQPIARCAGLRGEKSHDSVADAYLRQWVLPSALERISLQNSTSAGFPVALRRGNKLAN